MTVLTERPQTTAEPTGGWWPMLRTSRVVQVGMAMVAAQLAFRAWATFGAWYVGDDFFFISRMLNQGLSPAVAFRNYAGHIMPAPMYLSWIFNQIAPYDWKATATFLLLLQALSSLGLLRLLVVMFGPRKGILPALAVHLFTVFSVPISIWWAAGANQLPLQIVLFFGLASHVRYLRDRRPRHLAAALLWILGGLLFYEKTILVLGAYGIVTLCYFASGSLSGRLLHVWTTYRAAIVAYVIAGAGYLAIYAHYGLTFSPNRATTYPLASTAGNVLRNWLTGVFGGPLRWSAFGKPSAVSDVSDLTVAVCLVLLGLLLRELRHTRRGSMRALFLPAFFLASNIVLVIAGRSSFVGSLIALDFRYQGESGAVAAIALACATMPILGATEGVRRIRRSEFFDHPRRVSVACVAISVLGLYSAGLHVWSWNDDRRAEHYFDNLKGDLRTLRSRTPMVDGTVPDFVAWKAGYPLNTHSHLLRQFPRAEFVTVSTNRLSIVAPSGHLRPAAIPPSRTAMPKEGTGCAYGVGNESSEIPLTGPLVYGGWWVRIGYVASAGSPVDVTAGGTTHHTSIQPGLHSLHFAAGDDRFDSVTISGIQGDAELCTNDVTVGRPEPATMGQQP